MAIESFPAMSGNFGSPSNSSETIPRYDCDDIKMTLRVYIRHGAASSLTNTLFNNMYSCYFIDECLTIAS
jgi:hypothetical protein